MLTRIQAYDYELIPRPPALGGGWLLRLLADGQELGRRVFPLISSIEGKQLAADTARAEALARATTWLTSIEHRPVSMRPRPADESGVYLLMPDDNLLCTEPPANGAQPVIIEWRKDDEA